MTTTPTPFDPRKPVRTRAGRRATIIAVCDIVTYGVFAVIDHPVLGAVMATYTAAGCIMQGQATDLDLENIPEPKSIWLNVYPDGVNTARYTSRDLADHNAVPARTAVLEIPERGQPKLHQVK